MTVTQIALDGFRNFEDFVADFSPEMNVIRGENAQGKTNLMEAIAYFSGAKSHRARGDAELIGFSQQSATLRTQVEARGRHFEAEILLRRGARRSITVNGVKKQKSSDLYDMLHTVLFCPEDLSLVKDGAAARRRFLDRAISQLRPKYADALGRYQRLFEHKTRILRDAADKPSLLGVLEEFNEGMARTGALVLHYRAHFIRRLLSLAEEIVRDFSAGREELFLHYRTVSSVTDPFAPPLTLYEQLRAHQESHRGAELAARLCLSGIHKDDMIAEINGQAARQYASQGQCRTIALALKLSERALMFEETAQWPVLLLDDVLSELDPGRQEFVLERIRGGQVFLTGCDVPPLKRADYRLLLIENGRLLEKNL